MFRAPLFFVVDRRAQALVEVAIFGVIIISIIGMIVKSVVTTSLAQQAALRTMREALSEAQKEYRVTDVRGKTVWRQKPYNLVVLEDRLDIGASKYGMQERIPYWSKANAVFSRNLFSGASDLSQDAPGEFDIPVLHMKINGVLFEFPTAAWKEFAYSASANCPRPVRKAPGSAGAAWHTEPVPKKDFEEAMKTQGSILCWDGYATRVFAKPFAGETPRYFALSSTAQTDSLGRPVINPFDATQGLHSDLLIETDSEATLTVPVNGQGSETVSEQTDVIRRRVRTNAGDVWATTRIQNKRNRSW